MPEYYKILVKRRKDYQNFTPYSWCYENFGPPLKCWYSIKYGNGDMYFFTKQEHYIQFMLTWCST